MPRYFCISIHFLGDTFHGRGDQGLPEWPPSPFRLIQAVVAAASRNEKGQADDAIIWLSRQRPPMIITPELSNIQPRGYTTYVPNNEVDLAARLWAKGKDKETSGYRSEKRIRPVLLENNKECPGLHYLWELQDDISIPEYPELVTAVRAVSQLGWGIDLVVANAAIMSEQDTKALVGERWHPTDAAGGKRLRVPVDGSLADLRQRHKAFLDRTRLDSNIFRPVPPLSCFNVVTYRRDCDLAIPPYAVFALRRPDDSAFSTFSPVRRGLHLMGMMRHTASRPDFAAALGWNTEKVASFVLGHGEPKGGNGGHQPVSDARLVFIPLPSIEYQGAVKGKCIGAIRRVMVTVKGNVSNNEFKQILGLLEGRELIDEKTGGTAAFLRRQSSNDRAIHGYFTRSSQWVSVTPVILPGYDDPGKLRRRLNTDQLTKEEKTGIICKLEKRIDYLLRKALQQAGYPQELYANAQIQFRGTGFMQGADLAQNYAVSNQHRRYRRLHVQIGWRNQNGEPVKIAGPICLGGGRYTGLGLFTPADRNQET